MGADSSPSDSTHDLDEQISQLMQCKPLSEQQVRFDFLQWSRSVTLPNVDGINLDLCSNLFLVRVSVKTMVDFTKLKIEMR